MSPSPRDPAPQGEGRRRPSAAAGRGRWLLLVNPHASRTSDELLADARATLSRRFDLEVEVTRHQSHAIGLSAAAAREAFDAVAVLGGDGTINEVANGLAGTGTALAPLPAGATNVLCRMLGLPRAVAPAIDRLQPAHIAAQVREIDLGFAGSRCFTFAAGVGLDASVVQRVDARPELKARWGPWFFAATGLVVFASRYVRDPPRLRVRTAAGELDGVSVLIQNGDVYTYFRERPIVLAASAGLQTGSLGGAVLRRARARDVAPVLFRALSGRASVHEHPGVSMIDTAEPFTVGSRDGRPVPLQVDGDHLGDHLEVSFSVAPGALRVIC